MAELKLLAGRDRVAERNARVARIKAGLRAGTYPPAGALYAALTRLLQDIAPDTSDEDFGRKRTRLRVGC